MTGLIIAIHIISCILLIAIILVQRGKGGGLIESFSGVESMFGTRTSSFLTRLTTILSILFFITCLTLAVLSAKQSRSLMRGIKTQQLSQPQAEQPAAQTPQPPAEEAVNSAPTTPTPKQDEGANPQ